MLVVMTYNVWLCLAVVAGAGLGYFIMAGLLAERIPRTHPRAKKSSSVFVLRKRTRKEAENSEKVEEVGISSIEVTDDANIEKKDGKDDNQNTAGEEIQTGNGSAIVDSTGNGNAVVDSTGGDHEKKETKEPETSSEDQNVEVKFGEESPDKEDTGKENPAYEADKSDAAAAAAATSE